MERCAWCAAVLVEGAPRYRVRVVVTAAADDLIVDVDDVERDVAGELRSLEHELERLDPEDAQDGVHREFHFTLCRPCEAGYVRHPLAGVADA